MDKIFDFNISEMEVFHCQLSPFSEQGDANGFVPLDDDNSECLESNEIDQILAKTLSEHGSAGANGGKIASSQTKQKAAQMIASDSMHIPNSERKRLFDYHTKMALKAIRPELTEIELKGYTEFLLRAVSQVKITND